MAQDNEFISSLITDERQRDILGSSRVYIPNLYLYHPQEFAKQNRAFVARLSKRGVDLSATQDPRYQQELLQFTRDAQDFLAKLAPELQTLSQTKEGAVKRGVDQEIEQLKKHEQKQEAFIHALVQNLSTRLPQEEAKKLLAKEQAITRRVKQAGHSAKDIQTYKAVVTEAIRQEVPLSLQPQTETIAQQIVNAPESRALLGAKWSTEDATFARTQDPHNYTVLEQAVLNANPNLSRGQARDLSEQYIRVVDALTAKAPNETDNKAVSSQFFRFIASDATKGVGTFLDNVSAVTKTIRHASLASALKKLEKEVPRIQERLGQGISEQLYRQVVGQMGASIFKDSPKSVSSPLLNAFGDVVNTVLGGGPLEDMRYIADLGALDKKNGTHFVNLDTLTPSQIALVHAYRTETMSQSVLVSMLVVWGVDTAAGSLTSDGQRGLVSMGLSYATREVATRGATKLITGLIGAGTGAATGGLSALIALGAGALFDKLGKLKNKALAVVGFHGKSADKQLAIAILVTILVVLFWGSFGALHQDITRGAPLALGGGSSEEAPPLCDPAVDPTCALPFCDSTKQDCRWPTQAGCVTQGPRDSEGQTHHSLNAIDIGVGGASRVPVLATHDGTVSFVEAGYTNDVFVSGKYGNEIKIDGTDAEGRKFTTMYAHLSYGSILVQVGQHVVQGQPIARTDNNGMSFGEHLHYEYRGGGDISEILPVTVPHCDYGSCPSICWNGQ